MLSQRRRTRVETETAEKKRNGKTVVSRGCLAADGSKIERRVVPFELPSRLRLLGLILGGLALVIGTAVVRAVAVILIGLMQRMLNLVLCLDLLSRKRIDLCKRYTCKVYIQRIYLDVQEI